VRRRSPSRRAEQTCFSPRSRAAWLLWVWSQPQPAWDRPSTPSASFGIWFSSQRRSTISDNSVAGSAEDGIRVAFSQDILVSRNVAELNGDDGIDVDSTPTTLTRNTANFNGDLGIEAVPGVTDGGRNKARGNGNPAQCINVQCK
jgi:parallel beta-helix repeat protein